jgi:hypothetical protein
MTDPVYEELSKPFDTTFERPGGFGKLLTYITTEQVVSRLNEALGVFGWSFEIFERGYVDATAEDWVRGRLTVRLGEDTVVREQFGFNKREHNERNPRANTAETSMKGAASDALKKCAQWVGVGLYLSEKEEPARVPAIVAGTAGVGAMDIDPRCAACNQKVERNTGGRFVGGRLYCAKDVPSSDPVSA